MTDQILTASLLSDTADIVDQTCKAMLEKAKANILSNPIEYYRWQSAVENGRMFRAQLQVLSEKFAEQEREQSEPRADISNCKTIADVSEAVNAFATQQFQEMTTPVYTDTAFRVGDKVRGIDEDGAREMTIVSRVDNFYWEVDDGGWWRDSELTLIERAK